MPNIAPAPNRFTRLLKEDGTLCIKLKYHQSHDTKRGKTQYRQLPKTSFDYWPASARIFVHV